MLKGDKPSEYFLGAILRAYDTARRHKPEESPSPSALWDYICMEALRRGTGGFEILFTWDHSRAKDKNRIGTIIEVIEAGYVPGLKLARGKRGGFLVVELEKLQEEVK